MSKRFGYTNSIFSSHKNSRRGGATTLISSNANVERIEEDEDQEGRYATAKGKSVTVARVYAPPEGDTHLTRLPPSVTEIPDVDWNTTLTISRTQQALNKIEK